MCRRTMNHPNDHGIKIIGSNSGSPLLVGYREGSHLSSSPRSISLCLGRLWYGTWTIPFLEANLNKHQIMVTVCDHQLETAPETTVVRACHPVNDKHAWRFTVRIPNPIDKTTTVQEDFEWYTRRVFRLEGDKWNRHGSYLMQVSTQKVVAQLERRRRRRRRLIMSPVFVISFLGSGNEFGGIWKVIVFAIGLCGQ